jgi:nicotinamide-nucleotide adenylyltransferase
VSSQGADLPDRGMIHGRFQPFHRGHLAYALAAADRCRQLFVGITNPDERSRSYEPAEPERHLPQNNPFSYTERMLMVLATMEDCGLRERVNVVPFPVDQPALWHAYVLPGTVHYLRVFTPWGDEKAGRLRRAGHRVELIDADQERDVTGTQVRAALRAGDPAWEALVPGGTARTIRSLTGTPDHQNTPRGDQHGKR